MTFASKKEADAHDKLLDMAEAFTDWLLQSGMQMDETQAENLGLYLAEQKESVQHILRTSKLPELNAETDKTASDADSSKNPGRQSRLIVRTSHHLSCRRGPETARGFIMHYFDLLENNAIEHFNLFWRKIWLQHFLSSDVC